MTTPLHMVSYGLAVYPLVKRLNRFWKTVIISVSGIIGGLPDLLRVILNEPWDKSYAALHRIVPENFIFFLHTVPDYFVHDQLNGGWNIWAWVIEFLFWGIFLYYFLPKINLKYGFKLKPQPVKIKADN